MRWGLGSDLLFSCDGDERGAPAGCGPRVLGNYLSSLFFSSFCRFDSLPVFMLYEPVTEFLTEFLSCSCRLCVWWRSAVSPLSSYLVSVGLILSRSLCFTSLSPSSLPSSSPIPVDRVPGGDGEGRDGGRGEARWVQEDSHR